MCAKSHAHQWNFVENCQTAEWIMCTVVIYSILECSKYHRPNYHLKGQLFMWQTKAIVFIE